MAIEDKRTALFMVIIVAMMALFLGNHYWPRPTEVKTSTYVVRTGDTAWDICEKFYMPNNAESFNEFLHSNISNNNLRGTIYPGQVILIRNEVYK